MSTGINRPVTGVPLCEMWMGYWEVLTVDVIRGQPVGDPFDITRTSTT